MINHLLKPVKYPEEFNFEIFWLGFVVVPSESVQGIGVFEILNLSILGVLKTEDMIRKIPSAAMWKPGGGGIPVIKVNAKTGE